MKKFLFIVVIIGFVNATWSQQFSNDRKKFAKELLTYVTQSATESEVNFLKTTFTDFTLSSTNMPDNVFTNMVDGANQLLQKRLRFYPEIFNYAYANYLICAKNQVTKNYAEWYKIFNSYVNGKSSSRLKDFINFSVPFFQNYALKDARNNSWNFKTDNYQFKLEKSGPKIIFENGTLSCYQYKRIQGQGTVAIDSITIYNTSGIFDLEKDRFNGRGGEIDWTKTGAPKSEITATFKSAYQIGTNQKNIQLDSVYFKAPLFQKELLGKVSDNVYSPTSDETRKYPQFQAFNNFISIPNLFPNIDYKGGVHYTGRVFVGGATGNDRAMLTIYNDKHAVFARVYANLFFKSAEKLSATNAATTIYLASGDSIFHPGLNFKYLVGQKSFEFISNYSTGNSSSFMSSFHQLEITVPEIVWNQGSDKLILTFPSEIAQEKRLASFRSMNYFSKNDFQQIQGMNTQNPLFLINNYCYRYDKYTLTEAELATALHRTVEQSKEFLNNLAAHGFIVHNELTNTYLVTSKVKRYIDANANKIDYDNIAFVSNLAPEKMPEQYTAEMIQSNPNLQRLAASIKQTNARRANQKQFGEIDLKTNALNLNEVDKINLSDTRLTLIFPKDGKVIVQKDRNMAFSGWVRSGKLEIDATNGTYDYASNTIDLKKTANTLIAVHPLKPEDGEKLVFLNSFLNGVVGKLVVDAKGNRSGMHVKTATNYPQLQIANSPKVYYNDKTIQKGLYDSTRFYFAVAPFTLDSLDNFDENSFRIKGELVSANIFPKFQESLKIMPDYSLGFITKSIEGGYPFYETKAKYDNEIMLTNNGLQGKGKIDFVHSTTESALFTFLPDSTIGLAKFVNRPIESGVEFPDVLGERVNISYNPRKQYMNIYSTNDSILVFKDVRYIGKMTLRSTGLSGAGDIFYANSDLRSKNIHFRRWKALSDSSDFFIKNKYYVEGESLLAFKTENVKAELDFKTKVGNFWFNNDHSNTYFPLNNYYCNMDYFKWIMNGEKVDFQKDKKKALLESNFISAIKAQDSLRFFAPVASYILKEKTIHCSDVDFIDIADARIYPDSGKLEILNKGAIEKLKNAKILANYATKYYHFTEADVKITSSKRYVGNGVYTYKDASGKETDLYCNSIYSDSSAQTIATGKIDQNDTFQLSDKFDFYGDFKILAANPLIDFTGATRINHDCSAFTRSWMSFSAFIDPKNIQIPVSENMTTLEGQKITAGLMWRDANSPDSVRIYPTFLSKLAVENDVPIITASGVLQFNPKEHAFQISTPEKLKDMSVNGNLLEMDINTCSLTGYGKIDLGMNYGDVQVTNYGSVFYNDSTATVTMNLTSKFVFPALDKKAFENVGKLIYGDASLTPLFSRTSTWEQALSGFASPKISQKVAKEYETSGTLKSVPKALQDGIVISGIHLKSYYNGNNNGLISTDGKASIVNIYDQPVMKEVPFNAFFKQMYSGNVNGDNLQFEINVPSAGNVFFDYVVAKKEGVLQINTSNEELSNAINSIKESNRKDKHFSYNITESSLRRVNFERLF